MSEQKPLAADSADPPVLETHDKGVATVRLNRPQALNVMSPDVRAYFEQRIPELVADPKVRCILITGSGKAFCAGGDIRTMGLSDPASVKARMESFHAWARHLLEGATPVVTAVNGTAAGSGFALALMGDIMVASSGATFRAGFTRIGVCPDLGIGFLLPRAVGAQRARDLLLTNRVVDSKEAKEIGIASRVVSDDQLMQEAMSVARTLADGPPLAIGLTRMLVRRSFETSWSSFVEVEAVAQAAAFSSVEKAEGIGAFLEKRKPNFGNN